jgi:hypothetical protein
MKAWPSGQVADPMLSNTDDGAAASTSTEDSESSEDSLGSEASTATTIISDDVAALALGTNYVLYPYLAFCRAIVCLSKSVNKVILDNVLRDAGIRFGPAFDEYLHRCCLCTCPQEDQKHTKCPCCEGQMCIVSDCLACSPFFPIHWLFSIVIFPHEAHIAD